MGFTLELHLCFEHKIDFYLYWEEYWGNIFQTSIDNREVDCHRLSHKREKIIPKVITDIQNTGSESMHIRYRNVDS